MSSSKFINKQKLLYKALKPCFCSAIQETVYFNADGLNHLLYDKHRPRNYNEKFYRMALIDYIVEAITKSSKASQITFAKPLCKLWVLDWVEIKHARREKHVVKVILRKKGNGGIYFWSIMQKKNKNNNKQKNPNR